ncbi:MAG: thioredoxin family protein [Polyangiaceae bacterium]|nr:thioredoxin family protein [Polyangiaceae bacterium]
MDGHCHGTGCAKCKKLYAETEKAILASGVPAALVKIEKIDEIMRFGVVATPAIVVNGEVKCAGRIPPTSEIVAWLTTAAAKSE